MDVRFTSIARWLRIGREEVNNRAFWLINYQIAFRFAAGDFFSYTRSAARKRTTPEHFALQELESKISVILIG